MTDIPSQSPSPVDEADEVSAEELQAVLDEQDPDTLTFEQMEALYASTLDPIKDGEIINGKVVRVESDYFLVDVGYKSEGFVSRREFPDRGRSIGPGDTVEVYVEAREDEDGRIVLSKEKANRIKVWDEIIRAYDNEETVSGRVVARIKGGLTVDIGLKSFLPGSQVDLRPVRNLDQFIGQSFDLKIIKLNRKRGNIVLSRRVLLEAERSEMKRETLANLEEGLQRVGVVKNITDYGAFIDLGGIDGLLHITDLSWGRVSHPSELLSIGDTVKVTVLKFDKERERVSLGHKQITPDPWEGVEIKYPETGRVRGRIVSITDYGAFVELEPGVEGLVHISEMSWTRRNRHPSKIVTIGDIVEAVVLSLDKEARRISLGMKQVESNPWTEVEEKYPVGSRVSGQIRNLTEFGAFVALEESIDGLIHISDISWTQRYKHPSEVLKKGDEVEAVVLSVDVGKERLSLGVKQLTKDPWADIKMRYGVGDDVEAEVTKITNFGIFAAPEEELEGLVHISEIRTEKVNKPEDVVRVGDIYKMRVIKIEAEQRKLGLSIRAYVEATGEDALLRRGPEPAPPASDEIKEKEKDKAADGAQAASDEVKEKEKDEAANGAESAGAAVAEAAPGQAEDKEAESSDA
ncbi:MAG: 30S ribosomal protein S1 [Nitrospinota bacterium]